MGVKEPSLNVFGQPLEPCSVNPVTGFYRDGCCNTGIDDAGSHTICVAITDEFLAFSKAAGNDLSTPRPEFGFDGLKHGQRWCLCAARWAQAYQQGVAPRVYLQRTHQHALEVVPLQVLMEYALDVN